MSSKKLSLMRLMFFLWAAVSIPLLAIALSGAAAAASGAQPMQAGQTFRDCSDCPEMVVIPSGSFTMGSSEAEIKRTVKSAPFYAVGTSRTFTTYEQPEHPVTLAKPFAIGKYLVTRAEFAAFVRATGYAGAGSCVDRAKSYRKIAGEGWKNPGFPQTDRDPIVCVSWWDAKAYIDWLNKKLGGSAPGSTAVSGPYYLPSEAEWEYAARAGTQTARWWGDAIGSGNADCRRCGSRWDDKQTAPVGSFRANPFGLYDMLGNAWEWTADCWNGSYGGAPEDGSTWTYGACEQRVLRGGCWNTDPWLLRSATRTKDAREAAINLTGFRVARTLP